MFVLNKKLFYAAFTRFIRIYLTLELIIIVRVLNIYYFLQSSMVGRHMLV